MWTTNFWVGPLSLHSWWSHWPPTCCHVIRRLIGTLLWSSGCVSSPPPLVVTACAHAGRTTRTCAHTVRILMHSTTWFWRSIRVCGVFSIVVADFIVRLSAWHGGGFDVPTFLSRAFVRHCAPLIVYLAVIGGRSAPRRPGVDCQSGFVSAALCVGSPIRAGRNIHERDGSILAKVPLKLAANCCRNAWTIPAVRLVKWNTGCHARLLRWLNMKQTLPVSIPTVLQPL